MSRSQTNKNIRALVVMLPLLLSFQNCGGFTAATSLTPSLSGAAIGASTAPITNGATGNTGNSGNFVVIDPSLTPTPFPGSVSTPAPTAAPSSGGGSGGASGGCTVNGVTVANGANRTFYFTSAATAARGCASENRTCSNGTLSGTAQYASCSPEPADGIELIQDVGAQTGFTETDACANVNDNVGSGGCVNFVNHHLPNPLYPQYANSTPKWTIQQWGSKSSIPTSAVPYGDGYSWANSDKRVAVFPSGLFEIGIDGNSDFGGVYRQISGRPGWPSLYLGYQFATVGDFTVGSGPMNTMTALNFNLDAYMTNTNKNQTDGYDASKNSIIFVMYVTVQNLNMTSPSFGEYIWLGIPIYNDIEPSPGAYINSDDFGDGLGTHMLIYSVPYSGFSSTSIWNLQWTHLSRNLLPDAKAAFALAVQKGLVKDSNFGDFYLSGMIIGFEVTGLNVTWMQFKSPSIKVKH